MRIVYAVMVLMLLGTLPAQAGSHAWLTKNTAVTFSARFLTTEAKDEVTTGVTLAKYLRLSRAWTGQLAYATSGQDSEGMGTLAMHYSYYQDPRGDVDLTVGLGAGFRGLTEEYSEFGGLAALGVNIKSHYRGAVTAYWGLNEKRSYWPTWGLEGGLLFDWADYIPGM
jgi:hypothetical protein